MATTIPRTHSVLHNSRSLRTPATVATLALAVALALGASAAAAGGHVGNIELVTRADGRALPTYAKDGRRWVVGTPGQEYAIRVCNTTDGRVLAVMSVDGVNIVSGDTASPAQSGYVLGPYECSDIAGWRRNLSSIAAFYFTELPDAYATRTGRPENLGVVGVAFFRERPQPVAWKEPPARIAADRSEAPAAPQEGAAGGTAAENRASEAPAARSDARRAEAAAPAPMAKIGTGHGRRESSYVQTTRFEREAATPNQTIAIHYDRRENLVAMGILPPPAVARAPNPFPAWTPRFVPDPPSR
jgi:pyruvate/2-oxoglutarate dehydrogenase complex dihydrolipoamide acyltransferase (E2) component